MVTFDVDDLFLVEAALKNAIDDLTEAVALEPDDTEWPLVLWDYQNLQRKVGASILASGDDNR